MQNRQAVIVEGALLWLRRQGISPSQREVNCAKALLGKEHLPPGTVILVFSGGYIRVTPDGTIDYWMDSPQQEYTFRAWLFPFLKELALDDPVSFDLPPIGVEEIIDAHVLGRLIQGPADLVRAIQAGRRMLAETGA